MIGRRGALVSGLVAVLLAPGCADDPRPSGSRVTIAIPRDAGPLNLYIGATDSLLGLVYDKLFEPSPYVDRPGGGLAQTATQIDPLTWDVSLRPGIRWHDGRPFTARDVAFTFERYRDGSPNRHSHHVSAVPRIDRIEPLDDTRVRFTCGYPCPTLERITLADLPILPQHIWQDITEPRSHTALPIGTGPYRLVEYRADQFYRFEANAEYYRGPPLVGELLVPVVPDVSGMFVALKTGEIDASAMPLSPELVSQFAGVPDLKVLATTTLSILELRPNYQKAPFAVHEVRRALSRAIDRDAIVRTVLLNQAQPGDRGYPHPASPWTSPNLWTPFDRAEAVRLLDEAGLRDRNGDGRREDSTGAPINWTIKVSSAEAVWIRTAELVIRQLAAVGLPATLETLEAGVLSRQVGAGQYDLFISEIGAHGVADPDQFIMSHRSGYLWNPARPYPEMDALFEAWKQAATVEDRRQASFRMQELFNRQPTSIALFYPVHHWAYRPAAFAGWIDSPGAGILHKWSFLPPDRRP